MNGMRLLQTLPLAIAFALGILLASLRQLSFRPASSSDGWVLPFMRQSQPTTTLFVDSSSPIIISIVMFGLTSAAEGQYMLKSIIKRTSRSLDLRIICSADVVDFLHTRLDLVVRPQWPIRVTFYPLTEQGISARLTRAGVATKFHAGVGSMVKLFLHELLPDPYTLVVDTDAFFVADPALLWDELLNMTRTSPDILLAFPYKVVPVRVKPFEMCSCTMMLNLEAMRAAPMFPSTLRPEWDEKALGTHDVWKKTNIDPNDVAFGDQGLLFGIWKIYPERFWRLSRSWNIEGCQKWWGVTPQGGKQSVNMQDEASQQKGVVGWDNVDSDDQVFFPGILHFNCHWVENVFEGGPAFNSPWAHEVQSISNYKWVWLNQRHPAQDGPKLVTHVASGRELVFFDERQ